MSTYSDNSSTQAEQSKPRKQRKTGRKTLELDVTDAVEKPKRPKYVKGKAGALSALVGLPLDVLFEIFSFCHPKDVLNLSRTTKEFRRILMSKSALSVWKDSMATVPDLPGCFPGQNEPQFINLMFSTYCNECGAPNIRVVEYHLRIRLCGRCSSECHVSKFQEYVELVPSTTTKSSKFVNKDEFKEVLRRVQQLKENERLLYIQERLDFVQEIFEHAQKCRNFAYKQTLTREQELDEARRDRYDAIVAKLCELGWEEEIAKIPAHSKLKNHPLVKQPTRLTERIWKGLKPKMVAHMEQLKAKRLEREAFELTNDRVGIAASVLRDFKLLNTAKGDIVPEIVDFCSFVAVKTLLDLPTDVTLDNESFTDTILPIMPRLFSDWRISVHRMLANAFANDIPASHSVVREGATVPPASESAFTDVLHLATTVFQCRLCEEGESVFSIFGLSARNDQPLFYPEVMRHSHNTHAVQVIREDPDVPNLSIDRTMYYRERKAWTCEGLAIDRNATKTMSNIIRACALDPQTTTVVEMDNLNPILACMSCMASFYIPGSAVQSRLCFGWRDALAHKCAGHNSVNRLWRVLSADEEAEVREIENSQDDDDDDYDGLLAFFNDINNTVSCSHCIDSPSEMDEYNEVRVKDHLANSHGIDEPILDKDYTGIQKDAPLHYKSTKGTIAL